MQIKYCTSLNESYFAILYNLNSSTYNIDVSNKRNFWNGNLVGSNYYITPDMIDLAMKKNIIDNKTIDSDYMKNISKNIVHSIYDMVYLAASCDKYPNSLSLAVVDNAIVRGAPKAINILQKIISKKIYNERVTGVWTANDSTNLGSLLNLIHQDVPKLYQLYIDENISDIKKTYVNDSTMISALSNHFSSIRQYSKR